MEEPRYLLMKKGLYYRPYRLGYTGVKEHAGRYYVDDSVVGDGVVAIHEDEAEDYSPSCWIDVKCNHLLERIDRLNQEVETLKSKLREKALEYLALDGQNIDLLKEIDRLQNELGDYYENKVRSW